MRVGLVLCSAPVGASAPAEIKLHELVSCCRLWVGGVQNRCCLCICGLVEHTYMHCNVCCSSVKMKLTLAAIIWGFPVRFGLHGLMIRLYLP